MEPKTDKNCSGCPQKTECGAVYEAMGRSNAPSIIGKVILAFLVPIGVFVGLLIGLDKLLPACGTERLRTLVIALLGFGLTFAAIWLLKQIPPLKSNKQVCNNKDKI